ncbi:Gypsy retrotransposon integrase-like protein 1 [Saxophila tyrrhenica]|uniref:Gypsy retrotransposon integrase-like protein 1 n=1 Tax=Saxophila tyrrhenica TaxID=1690608 RepID=A0AAV9P9U8_9PEZI|nr:Gypsy retrotransposon integrase-like protein 1 [Saxophila tyrrhenica]
MACSYDEPDRRMTAVEYIQSLERKVEDLEMALDRESARGSSSPASPMTIRSDRNGPSSSTDTPTASQASMPPPQTSAPPLPPAPPSSTPFTNGAHADAPQAGKSSGTPADEDVIETMVGAGEYDSPHASSFERYRGSFAGLSLLRRVHDLCKDASASRKNSEVETLQDDFIHAFDFDSPENDSSIPWDAFAMLPSRANFDRAIDVVVNQACCNMQFLDRPTLEEIARQVYAETEKDSKHYSRKPLALLYAVLALARRFEPAQSGDPAQGTRGYVESHTCYLIMAG